ncbi:hypothetical protein [Sanguibacter antarcticus]|nr:hypothetical protein [Sanguibacter antarcticus]
MTRLSRVRAVGAAAGHTLSMVVAIGVLAGFFSGCVDGTGRPHRRSVL